MAALARGTQRNEQSIPIERKLHDWMRSFPRALKHQIRIAADRLLPRSIRDVDGLEDERSSTVSVFNGPAPEVMVTPSPAEEINKVADFVRSALADGIEPAAIGLFVGSRDELPRARAAAAKVGVEATELTGQTQGMAGRISIGTMHFAKGLGFRAVAVMACDEQVKPPRSLLTKCVTV
jgi:superfamily I DNA/RNA helicase